METCPTLKFPLSIKWTGREVMLIQSQDVLDLHWKRCKTKIGKVDKEEKRCFEFVYPLSFLAEGGKPVEVKDEAAMKAYKSSWKGMDTYPKLVFPIQVKWNGKEAMVVENQEMLDRHWARCKAKYNRTERGDKVEKKCFNFVYPITYSVDGENVEITSAEDMTSKRTDWSERKIRPELLYPIEIQWEGKDPIKVSDADELRAWRMKCRDL
jgi:hypothetical protein